MLRLLEEKDFEGGFLDLLSQLSYVNKISREEFIKHYNYIKINPLHNIYVIEHEGNIIGCGTLIIEPKFIHNCGFVGHIEDVVVDKKYRGNKNGHRLINTLTSIAKDHNCYKVILNCKDSLVGFYEKCGYKDNGAFMCKYFDD